MKWQGRAASDNVQDVRTGRGKQVAVGGGLLAVVVALIALLTGKDLTPLLDVANQVQGGSRAEHSGATTPDDPEQAALLAFSSVVLKDTEDIWHQVFAEGGQEYVEPAMKVFDGSIRTACGDQSAAVGPFYCPGDQTVYLELGFFELLEQKLGAKGDFARAYVIAHEVGHHVQKLTGYSQKVHQEQQGASEAQANALSVRLELQADFLAGVFAHHAEARGYLEPGDVEEALGAASQIGDDVLQKRATGRVGSAETFTHGTGAQRVRWFRLGYTTGDAARMKDLFEVSDRDL
ncbi:MAG: neutral zinc metallopeptidase [Planctomycetes bacterium]|nr:neutral zinc metallopeptidase [Planctomycetota bacterium]MCB9909255.1 neutral zinc metallopeptidase [Planctomycetota bacterium]HPF13317.1 neutral zinc metallopeptidase [Planctomycetota bacterium]